MAIGLLASVLAGFWIVHVHLAPPPERERWIHDIARYFHPTAVFLHHELRQGHLPIWNPHQMAGMPFLAAHIAGPLYPPNLILLTLFEPSRALELHAVAHLLLAGVLTWLFARRLQLGPAASLAAGFAYMLSGALLALFYSPAYVSTCTWLPGVMLATHALLEEARARWALALASVLALAFLGGHAQGFVYAVQLAFLYALVALVGAPPERRLPVVGLACLSGLLGVGLVAAQLLPTLELLRHVPRAVEGLSLGEAGDFGAPPGEVLSGLVGQGNRFSVTALALPLLLAGGLDRARRRVFVFFALAAIGCGLFAMGDRTPLFALYHRLPGGDLFRFPYRIAFVYAFCVSCLIGLGVQGAQAFAARLRPEITRLPAMIGVLIVTTVVVDLGVWRRFDRALPIPPERSHVAPAALVAALDGRWGEGRLFIENFGRHHSPVLPYLTGMAMGGFVVPTYEPMIPADYAEAFRQDRLWRGFVNVVPVRREFPWTRMSRPADFPPGGLVRLLDLMSVRFYAAHAGLAAGRISALEHAIGGRAVRHGPIWLVERSDPAPRAYVVHQAVAEPDAQRAWERLLEPRFDPRVVAVSDSELLGIEAAGERSHSERAEIRSQSGERVEIDASCTTACLLVLTDLFFPGWQVEVDGARAEIHRVNRLFRGVVLPAGSHRVVYEYRPRAYRLGAGLTLATLLLTGTGAGLAAVRQRSGKP